MPQKYEVAKGDLEVQGVLITIDARTKQCVDIKRIREKMV
jgi:calcineurin-like phosphoesterase